MSLNDCPHCWQTLCTCGYEYRFWGDSCIDDLIDTLKAVKKTKKVKDIFTAEDKDFCEKVRQYKKKGKKQ